MTRSVTSDDTTMDHDEHDAVDEKTAPAPEAQSDVRRPLWHPDHAPHHDVYRKAALAILGVLMVIVWAVFSIYWASNAWEFYHVPGLNALILNLDSPSPALPTVSAGATIASALLNTTTQTPHTPFHGRLWLGWEEISAADGWDLERLEQHILAEKAWVGVVIAPNTSAMLVDALNGVDNGYVPSTAVTTIYNQARNEQAAGNFIIPLTQAVLAKTAARLSTQFAEAWMQNVSRSTTDAATMAATLQGVNPALVTNGIQYSVVNLHAVDQPLSSVLFFVSMIYMIVLSFIITMMQSALLEPLRLRSTTWSYAVFRLGILVGYYFVVSAMLMLLSLAFGADFNRHFGSAGPVLYWMFLFLGMLAVGLAIDAMAHLLPTPALPLFFILWLISQLSVLTLPWDLQPGLYHYAVIMPAWQVMRGGRTIVFGNRNTLGQNYGVLIAWVVLNLCTYFFGNVVKAKRERAAAAKAKL